MAFKMVDMLESPKEQKMNDMLPMAMPAMDKPSYPYGLQLSLNEDCLEKLGVADLPEVGEMIHVMAMAKVVGVRENATEGHASCCVELQITHMALEDEDEESPSKKLYSKGADSEEDGDD